MAYNFTAEWIKGALNNAPDALSRNHEMLAEYDVHSNLEMSLAEIRAFASDDQESIRIQDLRKDAEVDQEYQQLQGFILNGFPNHRSHHSGVSSTRHLHLDTLKAMAKPKPQLNP